MGNNISFEKWGHGIVKPKKPQPKHPTKAPYCPIPTEVQDLKLSEGDILEVIDVTDEFFLLKKSGRNRAAEVIRQTACVSSKLIQRIHNLEAEPWYFGHVTKRRQAKKCLLIPDNKDGAFLVWMNENSNYYLSVRFGSSAKHYKINHVDGSFYFVPLKSFKDIFELVQYYSKEDSGLCVKLNKACVKLYNAPLHFEAKWEADRGFLQKIEKIGNGEFGQVWRGIWHNNIEVAMKEFKVKNPHILNEIRILKQLNHKHVLKLYAVCTTEEPIWIITELMKNGSLYKFLRKHKEQNDVAFSNMKDFSTQIAEGMEYLESKSIVHRDLRADNILLSETLKCKIADFGLAHANNTGEKMIPPSAKIPVKWMAPEIFNRARYTVKCDVWSFGIVLMEIVTFGEQPYPDMERNSCVREVRRGYRMPKPPNCPESLYEIMLLCWNADSVMRPGFAKLKEILATLRENDLQQ